MGTYGVSGDEFLEGIIVNNRRLSFESFLHRFEGDVSAKAVAEAWNNLAKRYKWKDRLQVKERGKR